MTTDETPTIAPRPIRTPGRIEALALPKSGSGKVMKRELDRPVPQAE